MYIKNFIIILCSIIILKSFITYDYEHFNIFSDLINNPGGAVAGQATAIWNAASPPLTFTRDVVYNIVPNYTWVTRYYEKKNDWVRANKGLPPLNPGTSDGSKVNVNINGVDFNKSAVGKSIANMIA